MLDTDRTRLCGILIQIALSRRSQSARAVYYAILALACYHRENNTLQVSELRSAALRDLSTHDSLGVKDSIEHVVANLLLCVLEVSAY